MARVQIHLSTALLLMLLTSVLLGANFYTRSEFHRMDGMLSNGLPVDVVVHHQGFPFTVNSWYVDDGGHSYLFLNNDRLQEFGVPLGDQKRAVQVVPFALNISFAMAILLTMVFFERRLRHAGVLNERAGGIDPRVLDQKEWGL